MGYDIQTVSEWAADQVYGYGEDKKTLSYDGFQFIYYLKQMLEIYDRCGGDYHSEENK